MMNKATQAQPPPAMPQKTAFKSWRQENRRSNPTSSAAVKVAYLPKQPNKVARFFNQRGSTEQKLEAGKHASRWTQLSYKIFRHNNVRLHLNSFKHNLPTVLRFSLASKMLSNCLLNNPNGS